MTSKLFVLLLLLTPLFTSTHCQPQATVALHILVLTWPNGFCRRAPCNPGILPQQFIIHGVWPQSSGGKSLTYCGQSTNLSPFLTQHPVLQAAMVAHWPTLRCPTNLIFWNYQWNKHGTCSGLSPMDYFTGGLNALPNMLMSALAARNIRPGGGNYLKRDYILAIQAVTAPRIFIGFVCHQDGIDYVLDEIYICLDPTLQSYVSCNSRSGGCSGSKMRLL